ncbi:MAG: ORF6N domain-containing protein [Deltaproteobacteria bacterium]|nr:ORF6N domain-containing protein [Deltaproteobacteria bacterium]
MSKSLPTVQEISRKIFFIRGHRVMLDSDLAGLYGTDTRALNRAVRRNIIRFPEGFMFQLDSKEFENLMCQIGTSSLSHGGRRKLPLVFSEYGVVMLSSVLNSNRAIQVNIAIVRAFVRLREILESHRDLAAKLDKLEQRYDRQFKAVFEAIRQLMSVGSPLSQKRIKGLSEN